MTSSGAAHRTDGVIADHSGDISFRIFAACCTTLALYNVLEINVLVITIFKKYNHLYFWSLLIASWGTVLYTLGFFLKFLNLANVYLCIAISGPGWWCMVTGQSIVLYSRLHLLLSHDTKVLKRIRWMIIINAAILHPSTTTTAFGSNSDSTPVVVDRFIKAYKIMEKTHLVSFSIQESIISSIYLFEIFKFSKIARHPGARKIMCQVLSVNVVLVLMDVGLLSVEFAGQYAVQIMLKGVVYSLKLKLELAVLGKLIQLVQPRLQDFADIGRDSCNNPSIVSESTPGSLGAHIPCHECKR